MRKHGIDVRARANPIGSQFRFVERLVLSSAVIFDGQSGDTGLNAAPHILCDAFGIIGISIFEIGIHRQLRRLHDFADVRQHQIAPDRAVRHPAREGEARRGRRDRSEPEMLQVPCTADVPGVRQDKTTALMQRTKSLAPFCRR